MVDRTKLAQAVDSVRETAGMGICVSQDGVSTLVRRPKPSSTSTVVLVVSGAVSAVEHAAKNPAVWHELKGWGVSCGSAGVSLIGLITAGTVEAGSLGTATPMAVPLAVLSRLALGASATQCDLATYRVRNVLTGNEATNQALDNSRTYRVANSTFDLVGILDAAGGLKGLVKFSSAMKEVGVPWSVAKTVSVSRPMRRAFTEAMDIDAVKRLSAVQISQMAKTRIVGMASDVLTFGSSAFREGGVIHDAIIWIVATPPPASSQAAKH
jgi:hypothetical protein